MKPITKISDLKLNESFPGTKQVEFEEIVGKEIVLKDVKPRQGQFGTYVAVKFSEGVDGKDKSFITGSKPVVDKCLRMLELKVFPAMGTIIKVKNYFDFDFGQDTGEKE